MMKDEDLDKLFQTKLGTDRHFTFDKSNWLAVEKILQYRRKSKRILPFLLVFCLGIGIGLLLNTTLRPDEMQKSVEKALTTPTTLPSSVIPSSDLTASNNLSERQIATVPPASDKDAHSTSQHPKTTRQALGVSPQAQRVNHLQTTNQFSTAHTAGCHLFSAPLDASVQSGKTSANTATQAPTIVPIAADVNSISSNPLQPAIASTQTQSDSGATPSAEIAQPDSTRIVQPSRNAPQPHQLYLWAGLNTSTLSQMAWQHTPIARPHLGIAYSYQLTPKWHLHSGIGYAQHSHVHHEMRYTTKYYSFGATETAWSIRYKKLHFLEIPIQISYQIHQKQRVAAGLQYMHLVQTHSRLDKWENDAINPITHTYWNATGYRAGLVSNLYLFHLRYDYFLHKNWSLATQVAYSPQSMTDKTAPYHERPLQFKLFLNYYFLNF